MTSTQRQGRARRVGKFAIDQTRKGGRWVLDKLVNALSDTTIERGILDGTKLAVDPLGDVLGPVTNLRTLGWSGALGVNHKYGAIDSHSMLRDRDHGTVYKLGKPLIHEQDGERVTLAQLVDETGTRLVVLPRHQRPDYSLDVAILQTIDAQGRATPVNEERTLNVRPFNASPVYRATRATTAVVVGTGLYVSGLPGIITWSYFGLKNLIDHAIGKLQPHTYQGEDAEDPAIERKRGAWDAGLEFADPLGRAITSVYPDNRSFYHQQSIGIGDPTNTYRRWKNGTRIVLATAGAAALYYLGMLNPYVVGGAAVTASAISNGYLRGFTGRIKDALGNLSRKKAQQPLATEGNNASDVFEEQPHTRRRSADTFVDDDEIPQPNVRDARDYSRLDAADEDRDLLLPRARPQPAATEHAESDDEPSRRDFLRGRAARPHIDDTLAPAQNEDQPRRIDVDAAMRDNLEDQPEQPRVVPGTRRWLLGGGLRLGGAGAGIFYGRKLGIAGGELLGEYGKKAVQPVEDTYLTLKAIGKAFGINNLFDDKYDAIREIPEALNAKEKSGEVLTALETKIRDTYSSVIRSHDALKEQITFAGKIKEAIRTGQIGIGRVGEEGVELKKKLNSKTIETIDRAIIDFYEKLGALPSTTGEQGADAYEKFQNRHLAIRKFEEAIASIQKIRGNYEDLIKYLHGEYIVNPDKPNEEKKGALDLMATVAQEHYGVALKVKDLVEQGHTKLPSYQNEITQMKEFETRILGVAKDKYGFEPESPWSEKWRDACRWTGSVVGSIVGAGVGYLTGVGVSKLANTLSGRPEVYDVPQRRLSVQDQGTDQPQVPPPGNTPHI